jgi:hypothetical protein
MQKKFEEKEKKKNIEKAQQYEKYIQFRHRYVTSYKDILSHKQKYEEDKVSI